MESTLHRPETELDERQRAQLHAASHKALRAVTLAVLAAMIATNFLYDDVMISVIIACIGFVAMISHWYYQRQLGIDKEVEIAGAERDLRTGFFTLGNLLQFAIFFGLMLSASVHSRSVTARAVLIALGGALLVTAFLWWFGRRQAASLIEHKGEGDSPSYHRGERLGRAIARIFRRR